ncbi:MAG TPA: transglycosylase SLT domain-containing protein [Chloroflexota bacterium]|nr:transglycosylase SLT domain-containing protein [Chloroflexota bacterium]
MLTVLPTVIEADPGPTPQYRRPTPTPQPHVTHTTRSTPLPGTVDTPTPVTIDVPTPSAAELQQDARLRWGKRVPESVRRWAFLIVPAARKYHVDPNLVAAVMTMESNGDPTAWSSADARGLLQVLHGPWDPRTNVFTGVRMLASYLSEFQSVKLALAAYNAGPAAVRAYDGVPPYRETRDYVIIVMYLYALYSNHPLSHKHQLQYRRSLDDLRHFKDQRHKVKALARAADLNPDLAVTCFHFSTTCGQTVLPPLFANGDPFWPMSGTPDPLQHVGPVGATPPPHSH